MPELITVIYWFVFTYLLWKFLNNYKVIWIVIKQLPGDFFLLSVLVNLRILLRKNEKKDLSTGKLFEVIAEENPNKVGLYFEEQKWTLKEINQHSNKLANYFYNEGHRKGDIVAVFMGNGPEYAFTLLGLSKIGVTVALVNPSLRLQQLKHCLEIVTCKGVIFKPELFSALEEVKNIEGLVNIKLYSYDESILESDFPKIDNVIDLQREFSKCSDRTPSTINTIGFYDNFCYVYTSGTTGLPKAAIIKQSRFQLNSNFMNKGLKLRDEDRTIVALPLCHSQGLLFGVGQLLCCGVTCVILRKFSASNFWKQCAKYKATATPYIGEFCKYLYSQPPSPFDTQHSIRIMLGAGLRVEIWEKFMERFQIKRVIEYYGATEGNCTIMNYGGKPGAIGYLPLYSSAFYPVFLVKVDKDTGEFIKDPATGYLIKCKANEPGEIIGGILPNPARRFEGYVDKTSTASKIIRNAFKQGDSYFRSGDIIVRDEEGYFYFKDRAGDTFRWKGENVSTFEVEYVITMICGLNDVTVYGVEIPGYGGRAGMAAIVDEDDSLSIENLEKGILASLAPYARPIFLRILKKIETTVTFKLKKGDLRKEGYNNHLTKDKIYILINNKYEILTDEIHQQIEAGLAKL